MSLLISTHELQKTMGDRVLFHGLSFGLHEKCRMALLGPNGAGKSTLLKILAGVEPTDDGEVSPRRNLNLAFVAQQDEYPTDREVLVEASEQLRSFGMDTETAEVQASIYLSMAGFENLQTKTHKLSGGWRKRLSLAIAFAKDPDLLLLDEPTNHLDWDGIEWLEGQLRTFDNGFFVVSHDREFLKNQCQEFMEINRVYKDGYLTQKCDYEKFLIRRDEYMANQQSTQETMANKARRETEWLRAGVKARTTKSQSRIKEAHQLIDDLSEIKSRNQAGRSKVNIQIEGAGKRSKKFIDMKDLSIAYGKHQVLNKLSLTLGPKTRLGLLGENASGKTSLLKVLAQINKPSSGQVDFADDLKIVYFDQKREDLDPSLNLMQYLGDGSDHVSLGDKSIHVASYASRFLFDSHKMNLPIAKLSGGEQARLLIAKLLLQPADVLLLDEPTNDLDIATIEILEQSLAQFPGLTILVSHDRYFLRNLCNQFLGLDGRAGWQVYADVDQWLRDRKNEPSSTTTAPKQAAEKKKKNKAKLSYNEKRKFETIENDIAEAEKHLQEAQQALEKNSNFDDREKIKELVENVQKSQAIVDELYEFWQSVEEKLQTN